MSDRPCPSVFQRFAACRLPPGFLAECGEP